MGETGMPNAVPTSALVRSPAHDLPVIFFG